MEWISYFFHRFFTIEGSPIGSESVQQEDVANTGHQATVTTKSLFLSFGVIVLESPLSVNYGDFSNIYLGNYGDTRVSLKRIRRSQMDEHFLAMASTWLPLSHKHVLEFMGIYDDRTQSFTCLVSPYMENGTLKEWRRKLALPNVGIEERMTEVAEGLSYLHANNVYHGDLHGSNILLDHDFHVKIADFGLVQHSDSTATGNPTLIYHFTAPELFPDDSDLDKENKLTDKTDVYAFGCIYYEIHFDALPFGKSNMFAIGKKVQKGVRPERRRDPELDDRAWILIESCWGQDPTSRPTMDEVAKAIASWRLISE